MAPPYHAPLCHVLYTNAFGQRGEGFRHLFLVPDWPPADRQRIGRWLETLRPPPGSVERVERVVVNSFRIGPQVHACLARVDADFARDEHGRQGGTLVHAFFVPLVEGSACGHFSGALLAKSRELVRPETRDEDRLELYLAQCRAAREITVPAVSPEAPRRLDTDFLTRFLSYSSAPPRSKEAVFAPTGAPLADALAEAASALPPRLRLACRWAVGLRPTPEMSFVARTAQTGSPSPLGGPGAFYARWVTSHGSDLAESWEIRSWDGFAERICRS